jgi:hypothetical protein
MHMLLNAGLPVFSEWPHALGKAALRSNLSPTTTTKMNLPNTPYHPFSRRYRTAKHAGSQLKRKESPAKIHVERRLDLEIHDAAQMRQGEVAREAGNMVVIMR